MRVTGAKIALATALAIGGTALPVLGGVAAEAATSNHVVVTCGGSTAVRPSGYVITCRSSANLLFHMTWSSWGKTAAGRGTAMIDNCKPTCLRGHWGVYPVRVMLDKLKAWHSGKTYYSRLVLTFTAAGPAGAGQSETFKLPSHAVGG